MSHSENPQPDRTNLYEYANGSRFAGQDAERVFTQIFRERVWDDQRTRESVSGIGSSVQQTQQILNQLPGLLAEYNVQSILDIPCGDFHWMQRLNLADVRYTGADIVSEIVEQNQRQYARPNVQFVKLNLLTDKLPTCDLALCRDCMVHFSFADIQQAIANIRKSRSTYLLTTTFPDEATNQDIPTGGWRPLNLQRAPFHFPEPLFVLNENCTEMNGVYRDKSLALWRVREL